MEHFRIQLRAISGIFKRDVRIFFRYPMNAVFRFVEPVIWLTPVYFMGKGFAINGENTGFAAYTGNGDYMAFIILGTVLSSYVSAVLWGIGFSLKNQMDTGVLESNWLTPVPRVTHLIGQTLFNLFSTTINSISVALITWLLFGFALDFSKLIPAVITVIPMIVALYGFGFAFAAIVLLMRDANTLVDTGNYIVNMLTGAHFPVAVLPRYLLAVSLALPLTYGYDAVRGMLIGTRIILPIRQEVFILIVFMVLMTILGLAVFRRIEYRCRKLGTIGKH